jgi:O-antigen/teichoic acid export membrane protein
LSQLKKGAFLAYVQIILTNVIGLILTPYIVRSLGESEYGVYLLVGSLVAYLGLMDLGINNAIIRYVANYKAQNDKEGEKEFLGTIMCLYIVISLLLTLIGIVIYFNLDEIFAQSLTIEELRLTKIMFAILIGNVALALPGGTFFAICNGYERFVFPAAMSIAKYVIRAFVIFYVLSVGGKAISIVVIDTVLAITMILIAGIFVRKKLKVKISLKSYNKKLIGDVLSYSIWIFIYGIVYKFQWNSGQIILGITTDAITIGVFGIGVMLGGYYGAFAGGINGVLIPRATQMVVQKSSGKDLTEAMIKIGRVNTLILFVILSGFILFGQKFISLWVGETYKDSWGIALLLMLVMTLPLIQAFGNSLLEAQKKNRYKSLVSLVSVSIAVVIGFFLSKDYGMYGLILPLIIAMFLNNILMNFYYKKIFNFQIGYFFKNTLLKPLLVFIPLTLLTYFLLDQFVITNWMLFLISTFIFGFLTLIISYFTIMNDYEKKIINNIIKR